MVYALWAAVVVLAVLCALNLALGLGIIRRLREHTERLNGLYEQAGGAPPPSLLPGETVAEFEAGHALRGRTLVGFFSPSCSPCTELAPKFAELASTMPREQVIAVIAGLRDETGPMRELLEPVAMVDTAGPDGGSMAKAFKVAAFPRVFLIDDSRTVLATGHDLADVLALTAARG
ncbi:thioredoxin domain-containing protein [Nonomuraea sp. B5E05]|uniref:TlpA family protein disulfide reductase n=1 Tax=Nonomuraea sp. B5E05 TaxID=3153569 RepID=UPI003260D7D7